jgi:FkbM family methyltransferase
MRETELQRRSLTARGATRLLRRLYARVLAKFRPTKPTVRHVQSRGLKLVVLANEDIGWALITRQGHEEVQQRIVECFLRDSDVFFDVGANIGLFTIPAARAVECGKVVAFEPVPLNAALLELNVELNRLCNVEVHKLAVGETEGISDLVVCRDGAFASLRDTGRRPTTGSMPVRVSSLDAFCDSHNISPDVMKIDAEGAEMSILRGAIRLLNDAARKPRALLVELNPTNLSAFGDSPEVVVGFMADAGYDVFSWNHGGLLPGLQPASPIEDRLFLDNRIDHADLKVACRQDGKPSFGLRTLSLRRHAQRSDAR